MPYSTPSASQYIQIRRLQSGINGKSASTKPSSKRANDTYEGYAGTALTTLPPNALTSNKFIPETGGGGGGGGIYTIDLNTRLGTTGQRYEGSFSIPDTSFTLRLGGTALLGHTIGSFAITIGAEIDVSTLEVSCQQASVRPPDVDKGITFIEFTVLNLTNIPEITSDIIFTGLKSGVTITIVAVGYSA